MPARVRRVTTTRAGGVSKPPFDTFNLGDHVGDDPAAVAANRRRLADALGLAADALVWMNQVHSDHVAVVDGPRGAALADARAGVIGAAHAGRVGAQLGIVERTVEKMVEVGAQVADMSVLLGPAVSGRRYEVPEQMAAEVEKTLPGSRCRTARGTPGLDIRAGLVGQLQRLGVTSIDVDPRCTVEDRALFSHRRGAPTGRLASLVWME
nr:polyphenol oxidase family protein [Mycolicibacterium neoaurum]